MNKIYFEEEFENIQNDNYQTSKELLKVIFRSYINHLDEERLRVRYSTFSLIALDVIALATIIGIWRII